MNEDKNYLSNLRHSCAHLLAAAVMDLWPKTKRAIGPAIENGFYFDFEFVKPISESDFPKIEQKMHEIVKSWKSFERLEVSNNEAMKQFSNNPYKQELIKEFVKDGQKLTFYKSGDYWDLCRGGHVESPLHLKGVIRHFKLLSIAGAYWRGDEKNKMLTRIYGTCFPTKEELDKYLWQQEEAKKRDHRKIGEKLELFTISEKVGQGLILWLPNGTIIKDELEKFAKKTEKDWGYLRVSTPVITKSGLYYTSGHLPFYKNDMYPPMKLDDKEEYYLKPMNCPHHHMIYDSKSRSYKELPLRLAEYGACYRYEASGELFGLMRVRGMTQNDAHIYCTIEQAVDEFVDVMKLHEYYYKLLGITEYHLELALRDPKNKEKYHGGEKMWKLAEDLMRKAVSKTKIKLVEQIGNAAFYGPKIDFIVKSSIGREFAVSTNQIDLFMAKRFNLKYIDKKGKEQTPVIIHRAPLGSHERFIGFLIEHYAGAFPLWLSPVPGAILPISDKQLTYSTKVKELLEKAGLRVELSAENKTIGAKIRESSLQKIPYMIIIGAEEIRRSTILSNHKQLRGAEGTQDQQDKVYISIRTREGKDFGMVNLYEFIEKLKKQIEKFL